MVFCVSDLRASEFGDFVDGISPGLFHLLDIKAVEKKS